MSVEVRPASVTDIDTVCDLLHDHMSAKIGKERWRSLLDYPWRPPDADRGHVAMDGGRAIGFLGLVYVDRTIDGATHRFCNICAWYLQKEYRGRGIGQAMQRASVADPEKTYTLVTATATTDRAFRASGLEVADGERYILRRRPGVRTDLESIEGPDAIGDLLAPGERKILADHRAFNLRHIVFRADGGSCYLIVQVKKQGDDIHYHQIMYRSDAEFLAAHAPAIADAILAPEKSVLAIDRRFLPAPCDWESEPLRQPRLYRSPDLAPDRIDHLYNEIVLLDLKLP